MTRMTLALALVGFALSASAADPKQDPRLLDEFSVTDPGGRAVFIREADGFRVYAPRNPFDALYAAKNLYRRNVWDLRTSYAVGGDFEYVVSYDVAQLGEPGKPPAAETNAEVSVINRGRDGIVALNVNAMPDAPKCFRTMRVFPGSAGTHFNMTTFPRKSDTGRLGIRRKGSELSLLAADGPGEPLVELVRYPHDPRSNPNLRMSAYAGNEASRGAVDVAFRDVAIRADAVLRGPAASQAAPPPPPPRASYPVAIDYSRNPAAILTDFNQTNDTAKAFRVEGDGLRVQPPTLAAHVKDAKAYWYRDSRYSLHGDFEFAVRYDLAQLGPVGREAGYRSAAICLGVETGGPIGSVSLSRGLSDTTQRFSVTHYSPTKAGSRWDTQTFPASATSGRLVVRRVGAEMSFLVTEGTGPERLLVTRPWVTDPVPRVRVLADQGGTPVTPVSAKFTELTVRAEALTDLQTGAPIGPPPRPAGDDPAAAAAEPVVFEGAPTEKSNKFRNLGLAAFALAAALAVGGAVALLLRRRGGTAKGTSTAEGT